MKFRPKSKGKRLEDAAWFAKHFPSAQARAKADEAIDMLDPTEPMTSFIDAWFAAYISNGGKTELMP